MVVVFGSINVDGVLHAERLPEVGETVIGARYQTFPGGKGANQAVAAARFGAPVAMVGCVGRDAHGERALESLAAAGVDTAAVARGATATGYASVWVDDAGRNQIIVASGANLELAAARIPPALLGPRTTLLAQLEVRAEETYRAIETAKAEGARVLLNAAPFHPLPASVLAAVDVLVVNEVEARGLADALGLGPPGSEGDSGDELDAAAAALAHRHEVACVVTRGAAGASAFPPGSQPLHVAPLPVAAVDTTGAGDAFAGCLAAALDEGQGLAAALRGAAAAGALACTGLGAQSAMPARAAIERALQELEDRTPP